MDARLPSVALAWVASLLVLGTPACSRDSGDSEEPAEEPEEPEGQVVDFVGWVELRPDGEAVFIEDGGESWGPDCFAPLAAAPGSAGLARIVFDSDEQRERALAPFTVVPLVPRPDLGDAVPRVIRVRGSGVFSETANTDIPRELRPRDFYHSVCEVQHLRFGCYVTSLMRGRPGNSCVLGRPTVGDFEAHSSEGTLTLHKDEWLGNCYETHISENHPSDFPLGRFELTFDVSAMTEGVALDVTTAAFSWKSSSVAFEACSTIEGLGATSCSCAFTYTEFTSLSRGYLLQHDGIYYTQLEGGSGFEPYRFWGAAVR